MEIRFVLSRKSKKIFRQSVSVNWHQSRCRTLILMSWSRDEKPLLKMSGWIFFFVLLAWSQMNLHIVRNGCSWPVWFHWLRTTLTFVSWDRGALVSHISIKRFLRTVSWSLVDRQQLQTSFIIWDERRWDWSACGTALLLMKWQVLSSRIKMVSRLWRITWHLALLLVAKKKRLLLLPWSLLVTSIRVWMYCWKHPVYLHLSHRKWEQIQHFLTVCIVIFQVGRYRSLDRSISPMITVLSVIIWLNLFGNFVRNSMVMHLTTISAWEEIWISVIRLQSVAW